jgi:phosphosulfolactate phosphohydrolase-like enzyme
VLVCAGTGDGVADEDVLAAKTILEILQPATGNLQPATTDLASAIGNSQNGRRLLANLDLRADVAFCAQRDVFNFVVALDASGALRKL